MFVTKPSAEFFNTLGNYVYSWWEGDVCRYVGKGVGDRCWAHVTEKEYDPNEMDLKIEAKELTDRETLILESYLIKERDPKDNKVAGHHADNFLVGSVNNLYADWKAQQRHGFQELHAFTEDKLELIAELKMSVEANPSMYYIETNSLGGKRYVYAKHTWKNKFDEFQIIIEGYSEEFLEELNQCFIKDGLEPLEHENIVAKTLRATADLKGVDMETTFAYAVAASRYMRDDSSEDDS